MKKETGLEIGPDGEKWIAALSLAMTEEESSAADLLECPKRMKNFEELRALAGSQVELTLKSLPPELAVAAAIPILLERMPSPEDIEEGIDSDILGLFVGPTLAELENSSVGEASHILLYLENIWEEAEEDPETFAEEVRITLLHELGHYLSWDEDDLEARGLG